MRPMLSSHNARKGAHNNQQGMAILALLVVILVISTMSAHVLYVSGKELGVVGVRLRGAQSLYLAEAGAFAGRAALMVLMNADPADKTLIHPSLTPAVLSGLYAGGSVANQDPMALFNYLVLDGLLYTLTSSPATNSVAFHVNWSAPQTHRKLQLAVGTPPANPVGAGTYSSTVTLSRRAVPHASCGGGGFGIPGAPCYIHRLAADEYEFFFTYSILSDGVMPPQARRRVTLTNDFSIRVRRQSFSRFSLFTHIHSTPSGSPIWFVNNTSFDGPVHTNGEFRFAYFPKFSDTLTSVSQYAWFNNIGSPVRRQANENVVAGVRRDAPVQFDATPSVTDDYDNLPANFTRGVGAVPMPDNAFSQKGVSIGRDPTNTTTVTNDQIRAAIPELPNGGGAVPAGIYVPVTDANANGVSDGGEAMGGGIYVQGNLDQLTLVLTGPGNSQAAYYMVQGSQNVTVVVDRAAGTTTVTNSSWPAGSQTRTFAGVPKGWQGVGNANAGIIFVEGNVNALGGTLEEKEQTTIAASGRIDIADHLRYEVPPVVTDPNSNPINVLGLYSASNDIRITTAAPNDLDIHAVLMAGTLGDAYNSSIHVQNYNSGAPRGTVHLIGGVIEEYYGAFGTFDPATGQLLTGYGRDFKFDRRMARGFAPPWFPTTQVFEVGQGAQRLAGVRPTWREAQP